MRHFLRLLILLAIQLGFVADSSKALEPADCSKPPPTAPITTLSGQAIAAPHKSRTYLSLPHISQPQMGSYCTQTSVAIALQGYLGITLSLNDMKDIASVASQKMGEGAVPSRVSHFLRVFGLETESRSFNAKKYTDLASIRPVAESAADVFLCNALKHGACVFLGVDKGTGPHMILVVGYYESSKSFIVHDPNLTEAVLMSRDALVSIWPFKFKPDPSKPYQLNAHVLKTPNIVVERISAPDASSDLGFEDKYSPFIGNKPGMTTEKLSTLGPDVRWYDVAASWESGRNPSTVRALATVVKLNIAAGLPIFLTSSLEGGGMQIICAHGYTGRHDDSEGTIKVTGDFGTKDITTDQLLKFCAVSRKSKTQVIFGFTKKEPKEMR
jgi:hypothetical protein